MMYVLCWVRAKKERPQPLLLCQIKQQWQYFCVGGSVWQCFRCGGFEGPSGANLFLEEKLTVELQGGRGAGTSE